MRRQSSTLSLLLRSCLALSLLGSASHGRAEELSYSFADEATCGDAAGHELGSESVCWYLTADALVLHRNTPSSAELISNTANSAQALDAADFEFGFRTGYDLSLARRTADGEGLELRYFAVDHWHATASEPTTSGQLLRMNSAVPVFTTSGTSIEGGYASALRSSELNRRVAWTDCWNLLGGFRYLELDEHLSTHLVNSPVPLDLEVNSRNRLYGLQLGADSVLWNAGGPLTWQVVGKAGVFHNAQAQASSYSTGLVTLPSNGGDDHVAFVGEFGVTGEYVLTDCLSLRGGYRLLWVDGVALAADQVLANDFTAGQGLDSNGDVFYHGAFGGLQLVW